MATTGVIKFDGIAVVTVEANMMEKSMSARAAFVNTKTGESHGFTDGSGHVWSPETKIALATLVSLMERDLGNLHFTSSSSDPVAASAKTETGGIGEHVGDTTPST